MPRARSDATTVLVVGPVPPPIHGAARVTAQVVDALRAAGADVVAVDTSGADGAGRAGYHLSRLRIHLSAAARVLRDRRRLRSLYLTGAGGFGLWYQVLLVATGRLAGCPTVFHHHSYAYVTRRAAVMTALTRIGGRRLQHVALCDGMAETLCRTYPAIGPVRSCSNAGLFDPAGPIDEHGGALVLGHLGNLSLEKGVGVAIDTLRRVRADGLDVRLLLGGPAATPEAEVVITAARAEFGEAVEHLGPVPADRVDEFYRRIDVFVFPSRYVHEAEPLVVLEAARSGAPAIAFDVGCLGALVSDPTWLVPASDDFPAAASRALAPLVDPVERRRRRDAAVTHFAARRDGALAAQRRLRDDLMAPRH